MAKRFSTKFKIEKKMPIGEKAAIDQVTKFCERYDIDVACMDDDQAETAEGLLDNLVEYTRRGFIEFEPDFTIVQNLQAPYSDDIKKIKYNKIGGAEKRAMDGFKKEEQYGKTYALLLALVPYLP